MSRLPAYRNKISVTNTRKPISLAFILDSRARDNLDTVLARYSELLGREVSASVAVRRGLDLLNRYLSAVDNNDWIDAELATLVRSIR